MEEDMDVLKITATEKILCCSLIFCVKGQHLYGADMFPGFMQLFFTSQE